MVYRCVICKRFWEPRTQYWRTSEPPEWEVVCEAKCMDCYNVEKESRF